MSTSEGWSFDAWLAALLAQDGAATLLLVLLGEQGGELAATYLHATADEAPAWEDMDLILAGAGRPWTSLAVRAVRSATGGLLDNPAARQALAQFSGALTGGALPPGASCFDRDGRLVAASAAPQRTPRA